MTDQTENAASEESGNNDLMEKASVTGQVGSGHKGISHQEVVELYIGINADNFIGHNGETLENPMPWGYRKIANKFGCSIQNVRRHIKSEADSLGVLVEDIRNPDGIRLYQERLYNINKDEGLIDLENLVQQLADVMEAEEDEIRSFVGEVSLDGADIMKIMKDKFGNKAKTVKSMIIGIAMPKLKKNASDKQFVEEMNKILKNSEVE